jgi:excisionase family DNA binding protein
MGQTTNAIEVTLSELAELMQATAPRILRLVENQGLPSYRKHGEWRLRLDEVSTWMNRQSLAMTARGRRRRSFDATQNQRA